MCKATKCSKPTASVITQEQNKWLKALPVLAGIELIFILAACMVLNLGFVTNTGLITYQCFSCYLTVLTPSLAFFALPCQQGDWWCTRSQEGNSQESLPQLTKGIRCHTQQQKLGEEKEEGAGEEAVQSSFRVLAFVFITVVKQLCFPGNS